MRFNNFSSSKGPGFVGTIIVNSISNILCTMGNETSIEIEPLEGTKFK